MSSFKKIRPIQPAQPKRISKKKQGSVLVQSDSPPEPSLSLHTPTALQSYLKQVSRFPLLTKEEEYKWAVLYYEKKDPKAAEVLIQSNLRFVISIAKRYNSFSSKIMDLIQEGNVGLLKAVQEFNPYKGVRLITYAVWWIRGYIQDYLIRNYSLVQIGKNKKQRKLFYALQREKEKFDQFSERKLLPAIASQTETRPEEVREMRQRLLKKDASLDQKLNSESQESWLNLQSDPITSRMEDLLSDQQQSEMVRTQLKKMKNQFNSREQYILNHRLLNETPYTLQKIADQFKVSKEAIRQMEERLLKKIRKELLPLLTKPS